MQWLILIGDESFDLDTIKSIKHYGCVKCYDVPEIEGRYCVDFGEDHIFYDYDENIDEFEDDLIKIPFLTPHFVTMIYTSKNRVKSVLKQDNFPANIYVDNDYGMILPLEKFIQRGMPLDKDDMFM